MQNTGTKIALDVEGFRKHFLILTKTQKEFANLVENWTDNPCKTLLIVSGGPGTGKSFVVRKTLDFVKTEQLRMSFTARSAQAIGGQTIHSAVKLNFRGLCYELEKKLADEQHLPTSIRASRDIVKEFHFDRDPSIVVVDEVSMINGWLMYWLIRFFMERTTQPLLFIAIGDRHQLNPVKSVHNLFSITFLEKRYKVRSIHLTESKRFVPEYERLINRLREFVDRENESGLFAFLCQHFPIQNDIDGNLLIQANRAMAVTNKRVESFNAYYLKHMVEGPEIRINSGLILKSGCIVFVTKNGCSSVTNGSELIFQRYDKDLAYCEHPKTGEEVVVRRDYETKKMPLMLGFAATIHKFQGDTIDHTKIVIHFDGNRDLNMVYTAVSRVKSIHQILAIAL